MLLGVAVGTRRVPCQSAGQLRTAQHLGTHVFDRLELADRSAELFADFRVLAGDTDALVGDAGRLGTREREREVTHPLLRSEEHTSELQSRFDLVCRLLLEKK